MVGLLTGVDFLDELSGVAFVGAPDVQSAFGLRYATAALVLFFVPQLASLLVEPPLLVLADRRPRKPFVVAGLAWLGACLIAAGLAPRLLVFAVALALGAPAGGVAVNLAQATLADAHPGERERMMARWAFMGTLGDLGTPALFAALAAVSLGWREAFVAAGALFVIHALALSAVRFPRRILSDEDAPSLRSAARSALGNRRLLAWLFGVALCSLLDETFVAFAGLHLEHAHGASVLERSLSLAGFVAGGLGGLVVTERLLQRVAPLRLLKGAAALCAACYLGWLLVPGLVAGAVLLAAVGFAVAPLYPIAQAQAYRALPDRSGLVAAAGQLFVPLELGAALAVGFAADAFGLPVALSLMLLQPLGILAVAAVLDGER